jgi:hypothetical protein
MGRSSVGKRSFAFSNNIILFLQIIFVGVLHGNITYLIFVGYSKGYNHNQNFSKMKFKHTFKIEYTSIEVDGNVIRTTKWYSTVEEIPAEYFRYTDATLVTRTLVADAWADILRKEWERNGKTQSYAAFEAQKIEAFLNEKKACLTCS